MKSVHATVTLKNWGNSIGLVLPAPLARAAQLMSGTRVEIEANGESLVIRKAPGQSRIEEMCAAITPENLHFETDWDEPQGNEAW